MRISSLFPQAYKDTDKAIWKIVIPSLMENLLTYALSMVTVAMIGRLTADEISAQSIGARMYYMLIGVFKGLGVGATVVVGIYYGAKKLNSCRKNTEQAMLAVFPLCLLLMTIILAFPKPILNLFTNNETILSLAVPYLKIAIWLCPSMAVSRIITASFNGQGDTRTPLKIAIAMNVINAILCYVFIFGLGTVIPAMGLKGAAYSLVASYFIGMVAGFYTLYGRNGLYAGVERDGSLMKLDFTGLKKMFTIGLPASLENMMWTFSAIIMSRVLLSYSSSTYAGYQLASQMEEFLAAPAFGFQITATALASHSIGAGDRNMLRNSYKRTCTLSTVAALPIVALMLALPKLCMRLLTNNVAIQQVGVIYIMMAALVYIPQIYNMIDFGVIRSVGYKSAPFIGTMIGMWCVRVPIAALAAWVFYADVWLVFAGIIFDQFVRLIFSRIFIHTKKIMT